MMDKLFCVSLRSAALVLGWMGCIGSILLVLIASIIISLADEIANRVWTYLDEPIEVTESQIHSWIIIGCVIVVLASVINLIVSALLILGTVKERHILLLPWLVFSTLLLILTIIYYGGVNLIKIASGYPLISVGVSLIANCVSIAIYSIVLYAMYSHYKRTQTARRQQQLPDTGDDYTMLQKQ